MNEATTFTAIGDGCVVSPISPGGASTSSSLGGLPRFNYRFAPMVSNCGSRLGLPRMMPVPLGFVAPMGIATAQSRLRFGVHLDAQTAACQRIDEPPMVYLNKGHAYSINLADSQKTPQLMLSTLRVAFFEDVHRGMAARYWSFWHTYHSTSRNLTKVIEINERETAGTIGFPEKVEASFDRVHFVWNGAAGAKVSVRLQFLSTDFSRIKGVKGIPMRLCCETRPVDSMAQVLQICQQDTINMGPNEHSTCPGYEGECCYTKIKLFRDKGAERKNKDDLRYLRKVWGRVKEKPYKVLETNDYLRPLLNEDRKTELTSPMMAMFAAPQSVTIFIPDTNPLQLSELESINLDTLFPSAIFPSSLNDKSAAALSDISESELDSKRQVVDLDPNYIPSKRRVQMLCLLLQLEGQELLHAIYLESLTTQELQTKIAHKIQASSKALVRLTQKGLLVHIDDDVVQSLSDEAVIKVTTDEKRIYLNF